MTQTHVTYIGSATVTKSVTGVIVDGATRNDELPLLNSRRRECAAMTGTFTLIDMARQVADG